MAAETTDLEAPFTKKFKFRRLENVKLKKDDVYQCRAWQVIIYFDEELFTYYLDLLKR